MNKDEYNPGWIYYDIFTIIIFFFSSGFKRNENKNIFVGS